MQSARERRELMKLETNKNSISSMKMEKLKTGKNRRVRESEFEFMLCEKTRRHIIVVVGEVHMCNVCERGYVWGFDKRDNAAHQVLARFLHVWVENEAREKKKIEKSQWNNYSNCARHCRPSDHFKFQLDCSRLLPDSCTALFFCWFGTKKN